MSDLGAATHAVVYTAGTRPLLTSNETGLTSHTVKVVAVEDGQLSPANRIDFAKTYTVEHTVKVCNLGQIDPEDFHWVKHYWAKCSLH